MRSLYLIGERPEDINHAPGWNIRTDGMDNMSRDIISVKFPADRSYRSIYHSGFFFIEEWCKKLKVVKVL